MALTLIMQQHLTGLNIKEFNSKSKQYIYEQESFNLKDLLMGNEAKDELNELFGEIVEIVN